MCSMNEVFLVVLDSCAGNVSAGGVIDVYDPAVISSICASFDCIRTVLGDLPVKSFISF